MESVEFQLVKRTYSISVPHDWISSDNRNKLCKFLLAHGAHSVKRTGSSKDQAMFVGFLDDQRDNDELSAVIQAAINMFVEGKGVST